MPIKPLVHVGAPLLRSSRLRLAEVINCEGYRLKIATLVSEITIPLDFSLPSIHGSEARK